VKLSTQFEPVMSLNEIACAMGISQQRVSQLYFSALRKLRRHLRAHPELRRAIAGTAGELDQVRPCGPVMPDWNLETRGGARKLAGSESGR